MKQINVSFDEHTLVAFLSEQDDKHMVAIRPICDALGISNKTQQRKILNDPKFSCGHMTTTGIDGKEYQMTCIPVDEVAGFLYGINSRKVNPDIAPRLIRFQKKLQVVMHEALTGRVSMEIINELRAENRELKIALGNLQQVVNTLVANQEDDRNLLSFSLSEVASDAGRALARQRQVKKLTEDFH